MTTRFLGADKCQATYEVTLPLKLNTGQHYHHFINANDKAFTLFVNMRTRTSTSNYKNIECSDATDNTNLAC